MNGVAARNIDRIERLATALVSLTVLYCPNGVPGAEKHIPHKTDYVDLLHRWIRLGLLAITQPILYHRARTARTARLAEHAMRSATRPVTPRAALRA